MAVTQYIGARYVPITAKPIEWSSANSYEPLTIVLYQGNSYTSRQYVPVGIDINNDDFWALTGNYNAQVEQYRQEVSGYSDRIDGIEDDLEQFETDIAFQMGTLSNSLTEMVQSETDNRELADTNLQTQIDSINAEKVVTVEDYGAKGDGETDCSAAIQQAIDENPNSTISFRGGTYIISQTIFLNGDIGSTRLDLNGACVKWDGSTSNWSEGNAVRLFPNHSGIMSNPIVMFAIERRVTGMSTGRGTICNGTVDCNLKADIAIQNVSFVSMFENLRVYNFMYAGIFNGTYDGKTYDMTGTVVSSSGLSTQIMIDSCYFVRGGDWSMRNTSAIFITYPDNQIDNVVTNRTKYGITLRTGGNSVSNTHITIQYESLPPVGSFQGCSVRLWPFSSGATQFNIFENCYFNVARYVFYTYKDSSQNFAGADLRTMVSNSHYTYYRSAEYGTAWTGAWYGGLWYGVIIINQCGNLTGDYATILPFYVPDITPSIYSMRLCEWNFANTAPSHENNRLVDSNNLCTGEWQYFCNSNNPIPANKYKRIARIFTIAPVGTNSDMIPGTIELEFSTRTGSVYKRMIIVHSGTTYNVTETESTATTTEKLYIKETGLNTLGGIGVDIYTTAPAAITEPRSLKISVSDPYTQVYMLPDAINYTSGNNQNIYDAVTNLKEIF